MMQNGRIKLLRENNGQLLILVEAGVVFSRVGQLSVLT